MDTSAISQKNADEVLNALKTNSATGLESNYASLLLKKDGTNEIIQNEVTVFQILFRQFKSAFIYLLLAAALISSLLGEYLDASFILLFVVMNASLGFYQEYKSEQTIKLLKNLVHPKVKVIRDSIDTVVLSKELVKGDIVLLETGDIVPADLRIVHENDLSIDESVLTGESISVRKDAEKLNQKSESLYALSNIAFSGTTVVSGSAKGVVIETGKSTQFGKIAKLTTETYRESAFEKQISQFSKFILYLILGTLFVVILSHLFIKGGITSYLDLTLFAIALAVGVVPEAMPLVTTFALSRGARELTKKKVVVKRLSAIEDLGSIDVLCSDKTGTLTENNLKVADVFGQDKDKIVLYGVVASSSLKNKIKLANNSFDIALVNALSSNSSTDDIQRLFEIPFDPIRKRNSVAISKDSQNILIVRGAPEKILPYTTNVSKNDADRLMEWIMQQGSSGKRVLAIGEKNIQSSKSYKKEDEERDIQLVGLISFEDPIKQSTKQAVEKAKLLKVQIKILTGDSREVAGAVAYQVGLVSNSKEVITGDEYDAMSDSAKEEAVSKYEVFARVSPEQKYSIIKLLKRKHQVGYLGEGINDAPALKMANVALVVEGASDIAREAADIVLLSQNLEVIINGIEEGRKTFVNTVKYIKSTLASNFGNFYAVAFASLVIDYLPMLPIQILLVNLLSDFPMISIATDNVEPTELKKPKNYDVKEVILISTILGLVSTLFDFIFFGVFKNGGEAHLQTNWFIGSILTELLLIYSIRTKAPFFKAATRPSLIIIGLTLFAGALTVIIPGLPIGSQVFKFSAPDSAELLQIGLIVAAYFATTESAKLLYYRYVEKNSA